MHHRLPKSRFLGRQKQEDYDWLLAQGVDVIGFQSKQEKIKVFCYPWQSKHRSDSPQHGKWILCVHVPEQLKEQGLQRVSLLARQPRAESVLTPQRKLLRAQRAPYLYRTCDYQTALQNVAGDRKSRVPESDRRRQLDSAGAEGRRKERQNERQVNLL